MQGIKNSLEKKLPVIFLMGPTASGKTDLAIALRQVLPVEIISVDSTLVYRGMNIGTAKPSPQELAQAPHRLIDIRDPAEPYSVADFLVDAEEEIRRIHAANKIPLLVGGTMLYFRALLDGLATMPSADAQVRAEIEREAEEKGWPYIHSLLAEVDPQTAAEIHPNHSQRLSRALEVYRVSGKTMTHLRSLQKGRSQQQAGSAADTFTQRYAVCQLALSLRDRTALHERIGERFKKMLTDGLISEVETLYKRGDLHKDLPAIRAVGYRQVWSYLEGEYDYSTMTERGIIATRQLAKRQLTWLRGWSTSSDTHLHLNGEGKFTGQLHWLYLEIDKGAENEQAKALTKNKLVQVALDFVRCDLSV